MKKLAAIMASSLALWALPLHAERVSVLSSPTGSPEPGKGKSAKDPGKFREAQESADGGILKEGRIQHRYVVPTRSSIWHKNYSNGLEALNKRKFRHAEKLLLAAVKTCKGPMVDKGNLVDSRLALGKLYLLERRYKDANSVYRSTLGKARSARGAESKDVAECLYGLARTELQFGDLKRARENAEKAVDILRKVGDDQSQLYGLSLETLGAVMARHGWYADAKRLFVPVLAIMREHPGYKNLDLADVLREQSLFYHRTGMKQEAIKLYEESYKIREDFVQPTKSPSVVGEVHFVWESGSTRSKEIIDNEFPFRYMSANGVRVAATVIDLWELLGVLVTVTNTTDHQRELDLGEVELVKVDFQNPNVRPQAIPLIDPESIDRVQKELSIWSLTHTRPWLANIQKTRTVRGFVPSKGHDLFRGPNVFGVYGKWKAVSHTVPQRVGLQPSRERVLDKDSPSEQALPGLLVKGNYKAPGVVPVWLEPFESRTGELFCLNPRDCDVVIKVPVGNAVFELPFHTRKKFPH